MKVIEFLTRLKSSSLTSMDFHMHFPRIDRYSHVTFEITEITTKACLTYLRICWLLDALATIVIHVYCNQMRDVIVQPLCFEKLIDFVKSHLPWFGAFKIMLFFTNAMSKSSFTCDKNNTIYPLYYTILSFTYTQRV